MAISVQTASTVATAQQTRTARAATTGTAWSPPSNGMNHTRPWRSSPLAAPAFSTLHPVILESPEEYEDEQSDSARGLPRTRPPSSSSIASQTGSLSASASGYASRNASASASALLLVDGEASTSSVSLNANSASAGANWTASSHGHGSSQSHSGRTRLSKIQSAKSGSDGGSIAPPPRARTLSHGHSRSASSPVPPIAPSPTIPQAYSRASPLAPSSSPESEPNAAAKQPPSKSRDPASNWMSSSPFGPAQTPKFSRLAMASPAVVMPLSAKEYRKKQARVSVGKGKDMESLTFQSHDSTILASQGSNSVPMVTVSPPPPEDVHRPRTRPSSPRDHNPDRRRQPQPQVDQPTSKSPPPSTMLPRPSSPKHNWPRSRPNTPPRSSPLASHPPISPKSSAGTFFSLASTSDDDASRPQDTEVPSSDDSNSVPPARPRPRPRRRKSHPERLSNGARLSLLEAMNHLSQEGAGQQRLSGHSQTDAINRLSIASQASGHTLFYDVESEDKSKVAGVNGTPVLHTQSLEDLSSTLARTGIEVVPPDGHGHLVDSLDDEPNRGKRNVRVVRISDAVEVSLPPVYRRRKLTKSRPASVRGAASVLGVGSTPGLGTIDEVEPQSQPHTQIRDRRASLLPWKSKGLSDTKGDVVSATSEPVAAVESGPTDTARPDETAAPAPVPASLSPIANDSVHAEGYPKPKSNGSPKKTKASSNKSPPRPTTAPSPEPPSPPRKSRRYTFSLLPTSTFSRSKREKSDTVPLSVDLGLDKHIGKRQSSTGTSSTSTSIRTITQGSQVTLVPPSPVLYDLTTPASSGGLSGSARSTKSSVPMLRRLTAQELATGAVPLPAEQNSKRDSTPSLITDGSTESIESPRTPSYARTTGTVEPFIRRPSGLKESFGNTSEDDSEGGPGGKTSRVCAHRRLCVGAGGGEISEDDERCLHPGTSPRPGSRPGTASSTATETSGSYASFSTVPASTISSSSRSESPSPVMSEKQDRVVAVVQSGFGDEDIHECALCGHRSPPSPPPAFTPSPSREVDLEGMHPMFTVPLVTIPASALGLYARPTSNIPFAMQGGKDTGTGGGMGEWHTVVPVPVVPPMIPDQNWGHMHVNASGAPPTARTMAVVVDDKLTAPLSPMPAPPKVKKRLRPQTAPPGTGDAALRFIEEAKAMRARQAGVDIDALVRDDRLTKHKASSGESKFKAVLRGLLRW